MKKREFFFTYFYLVVAFGTLLHIGFIYLYFTSIFFVSLGLGMLLVNTLFLIDSLRDELKKIYGWTKYKYEIYQGIVLLLISLNIYILNAFRILDLYIIFLGLVLIIFIAGLLFFYFFYLYRNVNKHSFTNKYTDDKLEKKLDEIIHRLRSKNIRFQIDKKPSLLGKKPMKIISFSKGKILAQFTLQNKLIVTAKDDKTSIEIIKKIVSE